MAFVPHLSLVLSVPLIGSGANESDKEAVLGVFANCIHLDSFKTELVQYILEILPCKYSLKTLRGKEISAFPFGDKGLHSKQINCN